MKQEIFDRYARTLTGLMREADQAMYRVKARCRGASKVDKLDLLEKVIWAQDCNLGQKS